MFFKYKQLIIGFIIGGIFFGTISTLATNQTIEAIISDITVKLNGKQMQLDNPAIVYQNRTYLPVRQISEALGKQVNYDTNNKVVEIGDSVVISNIVTPTPTHKFDKTQYITPTEIQKIIWAYDCVLGLDKYSSNSVNIYYIKGIQQNPSLIRDDGIVLVKGIPIVSNRYISKEYFNNVILPAIKSINQN